MLTSGENRLKAIVAFGHGQIPAGNRGLLVLKRGQGVFFDQEGQALLAG